MSQSQPGVQPSSEMAEMIDWLVETIQPLQGQNWQVTLNGNGGIVEAVVKAVQSEQVNERGHRMLISQVTKVKFRLGKSDRRVVFRTD